MKRDIQKILDRIAEEVKNKEYENEIVCPYCKATQDQEVLHNHVSYWGEDSKEKIGCESCDKDFYVEEIVLRNFETTTVEWEEKEE